MSWVFRTILIPASLTPMAKSVATALEPLAAAEMFTTGLAFNETDDPVYFVSSGMIEDTFVPLLTDATILHATCQSVNVPLDMATCGLLVSQSIVSEEQPFDMFSRLGLVLVKKGGDDL